MNVRVNYAGINKRAAAYIVDQTIFLVCCSSFFLLILFILPEESFASFFHDVFPDTNIDTDLMSVRYEILEDLGTLLESLVYIVLEALMITKLGWTPGKLLCGIYVKDVNTLKNIALMQITIRNVLKISVCLLSSYIYAYVLRFYIFESYIFKFHVFDCFLILPILILIFGILDQRKQFFYDKIAGTVVIDHKLEKSSLGYVEIAKYVITYIIMVVLTCLLLFLRIYLYPIIFISLYGM